MTNPPACRWTGSDQPRGVNGEHYDDCAGDGCRGCWPCLHGHCTVDGKTHTDDAHPVTCPECVGDVRENLTALRNIAGGLPAEVKHRGVNSEAMMLLGPAADPEAWNHVEASILCGRLPKGWMEHADGELHPLFVLGTWDMLWRDFLEHDEPAERLTVASAAAYLGEQLTRMAQVHEPPFGDFAGDLRRCIDHLRAVIHDQNQGDRANVGCFDCGASLERKLTKAGFEDHWTCRRCRRRYSYAEYNFALRAALEQEAS